MILFHRCHFIIRNIYINVLLPTHCTYLSQNFMLLGLEETRFKRKDLLITLVDVEGQRADRKKWLQCFDGVEAVLFVVSMSEYDQTLLEDTASW